MEPRSLALPSPQTAAPEKNDPSTQDAEWESATVFQEEQDDKGFTVLRRYRQQLYEKLGQKRNAAMDLMDALACQQTANSVTELSEQPQFPRQYASVTDAIRYAAQEQPKLKDLMEIQGIASTPHLLLNDQKHKIFIVDSTPDPHPHAHCLKDRSYIHDASNAVTGKPINIGIQYSAVVGVTEDPAWVSPIRFDRIPSLSTPTQFGMEQALSVCSKTTEPCVVLFDSAYNTARCRAIARKSQTQMTMVVRSACNRNFFLPATSAGKKKYGERVNLYNPEEGAQPDTELIITPKDRSGHLRVYYWRTTYTKMRGMAGYEDPSALVAVFEHRADGTPKNRKPFVFRVFVPERHRFNSGDGCWLYFFRFSIERFFSTQKKRLMLGHFQSPEVERQETFSLMGSMVYQQWYLAKMSGAIQWSIKPWHRYPKADPKGRKLIPTHVQKGFPAVLKQVGTPSVFCPATNKAPGRQIGQTQPKRVPQVVIRKSKKTNGTTNSVTSVPTVLPTSTESMSGKIKRAAAKVAANVIQKTVETAKRTVQLMLLMMISFANQQVVSVSNQYDIHFALVEQKMLPTPFEFEGRISDDGTKRKNADYFSIYVPISGKDPPKSDLNSCS